MSPLRRQRDAGGPPAPFVVGVGRSGTTLLRLMLDAHPELAIPPETHFLPDLIDRAKAEATAESLGDVITTARNWGDFGLDEDELRARLDDTEPHAGPAARTFFGLYAEGHGKARWGDKTPIYVESMRPIASVLPEARFVHLIRDGRDVALSRRKRGMGAGKPMANTAARWRNRIEDARKQSRRLKERYVELRYEDLVADPEPALRQICELCELEFDPAMLAHSERAGERLGELGDLSAADGRRARSGEERAAAHALAKQAPSGERVGTWQSEMSAAERAEFEEVAGELLRELGYKV